MKLSEAILIGCGFRGESHQGPFVRIANTEELVSDVWGAACEAVHSLVAKRNWGKSDERGYGADIEYLRDVQQRYFAEYFRMPATCPGAEPRAYTEAGGRFTGRTTQGVPEFAIERERGNVLGAVTSACPAITNLAELVEHMFYLHNWSREECAQAVDWYEQARDGSLLMRNFTHYQDETVRQAQSYRLNLAARQRERQRMAGRHLN